MATTIEALNKLTVAQLKAICKEQRITGYSKLAKPALIAKLIEKGTDVPGLVLSASKANNVSALGSTADTIKTLGVDGGSNDVLSVSVAPTTSGEVSTRIQSTQSHGSSVAEPGGPKNSVSKSSDYPDSTARSPLTSESTESHSINLSSVKNGTTPIASEPPPQNANANDIYENSNSFSITKKRALESAPAATKPTTAGDESADTANANVSATKSPVISNPNRSAKITSSDITSPEKNKSIASPSALANPLNAKNIGSTASAPKYGPALANPRGKKRLSDLHPSNLLPLKKKKPTALPSALDASTNAASPSVPSSRGDLSALKRPAVPHSDINPSAKKKKIDTFTPSIPSVNTDVAYQIPESILNSTNLKPAASAFKRSTDPSSFSDLPPAKEKKTSGLTAQAPPSTSRPNNPAKKDVRTQMFRALALSTDSAEQSKCSSNEVNLVTARSTQSYLPTATNKLAPRASAALSPFILSPELSFLSGSGKTAPTGTSKRFKPLVKNPAAHLTGRTPTAQPSACPNPSIILRYLDFPTTPPAPKLVPITLPPSLSQRKRVHTWSILLSALSHESIRQCVLVSKMFRYAIYLSAAHRLHRHFSGRRLQEVMERYSASMTNMWPYLRLREQELAARRQAYKASFLSKARSTGSITGNLISERLWTSPDRERQLVIALRFVLTRLWFLLSIGGGNADDPLAWTHGMIVDAQEVIPKEIWLITIEQSAHEETFYVLEATCEVIGHAPARIDSSILASTPQNTPIRADWSAYITRQVSLSSESSAPALLLHRVKWTNHEEYDHGISKLWLQRTHGEGEQGAVKRAVAERYVLACVVGNSVSGRWMNSTQMEQDFSGLPFSSAVLPNSKATPQINLFLPSHHHVESIHFASVAGVPLHPALAIVQSPTREYLILKDNGMQVGCEEEGVAGVWMELLGCNLLGQML